MVQINEVSPSRFRIGDLITISGFGFSPDFGQNQVAIAGVPEPVFSESATEIQVFVPAGVPEDQYVAVAVFRADTLDNDVGIGFSLPSKDDLRSGAVRLPGQVPGTTEATDPARVEDTPQAQDYERMVTALEHLLFDVLGTLGDVFASDGTQIVPQPIGAAGQRLGANPATSTGLEYAAVARTQTLSWGGRRINPDGGLLALVANGETTDANATSGLHAAPFTGTIFSLIVAFVAGDPGDTLDRVVVNVNAVTVYDTGGGLGVSPGSNHVAAPALAVTLGQTIEVLVTKTGGNAAGQFVAHLGVN